MLRRILRVAFYSGVVVLWLVLCALGLEVWEGTQSVPSKYVSYSEPIVNRAEEQDMAILDETAAAAPRPPAEMVAKYPVVERLDTADDAAMLDFARQWDALIIECSLDGQIHKRFAASSPAMTVELAQRALKASSLYDLVPTNDETHWGGADKLKQNMGNIRTYNAEHPYRDVLTEFMIPLDCAPQAGFRFLFHALAKTEESDPRIAVVITPWRWASGTGGFRPNYYERDTYPAFRRSEFWTNSLGFRTHEIVLPKPKGVYRIVCIGGSTTMEGPRNDLTYPAMLQELLRAQFGSDAFDVLNCGMDGAPIGGSLSRFDEYLSFEPDMIIHYNFVNDTQELINQALTRTVLSSFWKRPLVKVVSNSKFVRNRWPWLWDHFMPTERDYRQEIEQRTMPWLQQMNERAKKAGVRFAICSSAYPDFANLPAPEQAYWRDHFYFQQIVRIDYRDYVKCAQAFNSLVREFCARENVLYIPCEENLKGGIALFLDHCHFHVPGLRRKAQIVFDSLKDVIAQDLAAKQQTATTAP